MGITAFIASVASDQTTNVVIGLLLLFAFVDWITGTLRALTDKAFKAEAFDVFIRTTMSKVVNLVILLLFGRILVVGAPNDLLIPGLNLSVFTGAGILAAVPFLVAAGASILDNVRTGVPHAVPTA